MTLQERFEAKFEKSDGCWIWTASKRKDGYGQIGFGGRNQQAHRVSYQLYVGPIPEGLCVLHKCDRPACVNPAHLFLGTNLDNVRDRNSKGRAASGEKHGSAKLTATQVIEIRARCAAGEHQSAVARRFGVGQGNISKIVCRFKWVHV